MRNFTKWFQSIKVYRLDCEAFHGYKVADWGGWIDGGYAKTRPGAYWVAFKKQYITGH